MLFQSAFDVNHANNEGAQMARIVELEERRYIEQTGPMASMLLGGGVVTTIGAVSGAIATVGSAGNAAMAATGAAIAEGAAVTGPLTVGSTVAASTASTTAAVATCAVLGAAVAVGTTLATAGIAAANASQDWLYLYFRETDFYFVGSTLKESEANYCKAAGQLPKIKVG